MADACGESVCERVFNWLLNGVVSLQLCLCTVLRRGWTCFFAFSLESLL